MMLCPDCAQRDGVILALRAALEEADTRLRKFWRAEDPDAVELCDIGTTMRAALTDTAPAAAEATKHILEMGLDVIDDALLARLTRCRVELLDEVIGWVERRSPFPARHTLRALLVHLEEMKEKTHRCEVDGAIRTLPCLACGKV